MGRAPQNALGSPSSCTCCSSAQLRRGPWTSDEDELLARYMNLHGDRGNWRKVPKAAGLLRCGKSCRLRWLNYLRPDLKRGSFSEDEEELIVKLHALLGNRWSLIAGRIPGRSDNEIKNYWNFHLAKKLLKMGINPKTHKRLENTGETRPEAKLLTLTKSPREPDVSLDLSSKQVDRCSSLTSSEEQSVNASKFCHSSSFSSVTSSITLESPSAKPVEAPSRLEELIISTWNGNQQSGAEEGYEIIRNSSNEEAEDALFNEQFSSFGSAVEELELQNHMMMFGLSQSLWHSPLASPSVVDKVHPDFWN